MYISIHRAITLYTITHARVRQLLFAFSYKKGYQPMKSQYTITHIVTYC